jgi:hypothetical protein
LHPVAIQAFDREKKARVYWSMQKVVSNIFGKATEVLPSSHMLYVQTRRFEEMAEGYFKTV